MGPYGTVQWNTQHCVNGTRCNNHNNKWNHPLSHVYGTSQHLAIQTHKRYNTYFTINHSDSTSHNKQYQKCYQITSQSLLIVMHNLKSYKHAQHIITPNIGTIHLGYWNHPQPPVSPLSAHAGEYPYLNRR